MTTGSAQPWRAIVASSLAWEEAHATFDAAVDGLDAASRGTRPAGLPYSPWELVEHMRITQADLLEFMVNPDYTAPSWPRDYWPAGTAPASDAEWQASLDVFRSDRERLRALAVRGDLDLTERIPWGEGQTYLRTLLVAVDHAAYHVGQLVAVRRLLGAWPSG